MNKKTHEDEPLEDSQTEEISCAIVRQLDEQVDRIDASTRHRLKTARRHAIQQQNSRQHRGALHFASHLTRPSSAAFASVAAVVLSLYLWQPGSAPDIPVSATIGSITTLENAPVLSASDDLEFFGSIDFLVWMEKNTG